jgi:mono/diheme cytochrome c family protein
MQRRAVWRRFGVALIVGLLTVTGARALRAQEADGKKVFTTICAACHQQSGEGVEATFPPLAGSEWAMGDEAKLVRIILQGLIGPIEVAGEPFAGAMPGWADMLKDNEVAAVLNSQGDDDTEDAVDCRRSRASSGSGQEVM